MAWQVGEQVGAYSITGTIGSGGMATVYQGHHAQLDRDVAIKVMHPAFHTDPDFIARFQREARIVARLEHPHIVPVYDFSQHDGQPYLVMKYVIGQTLKERFAEAAPTLDEIVQITNTVASALDYAHGQGILHRDIKPSNVMIAEDGTPYLTDFGLARLVASGESTMSAGMVVGTPNYVSPEQAEGGQEITARADVYSFGVMLYEMVVGRVPFQGKTPFATIHKHIYEPPPLPSELNPEVPPQVEAVLLKALEKAPADRYATPGELARAFEEAVNASGLTALSPERSGIRPTPAPQQRTPQPAPDEDKPKRRPEAAIPAATAPATDLLLLEGEESWANLPQSEIVRRRQKKRNDERVGLIGHALPYIGVNAMIIFGSLVDGDLDWGTFITPLAWGAGLAAHAIHTYYQSSRATEKLYHRFDERMTDDYGPGWRNHVDNGLMQEQWTRAKTHYAEIRDFQIHAGVYAMIISMMWLIYLGTAFENGFYFPWPLIVTLAWGTGLLSHGAYARGNTQLLNAEDDARVQSELAMMQGLGSGAAKRKNDRLDDLTPMGGGVRLTDEGELTESMVEEFEDEQRRYRS